MEIKYLSLFSGIGGFELGIQQSYENNQSRKQKSIQEGTVGNNFQRSGNQSDINSNREKSETEQGHRLCKWSCVGYSEIDKYAIQIYEKHFDHKNYGDITKINPSELPDFDLVCGGFPCQSFSIAGKRGGFEDTRGTLFFDIARIVRVKRPRYLFLENVRGLLNHDEGNTFATIIATIDELGYDCQWQVLNSKNFGVPQNRERVFIIGHLRGTPRPQIFPIGKNSEADIVLPTLTARYWGGQANGGYIGNKSKQIRQLNDPPHSNERIHDEKGIAPTLNTMQGGNRQPFVALTENRMEEAKQISIRRLTPIECERLQGFPDGWTKGISDSQRYKCLGNAVTVNVIQEIIKKLT